MTRDQGQDLWWWWWWGTEAENRGGRVLEADRQLDPQDSEQGLPHY